MAATGVAADAAATVELIRWNKAQEFKHIRTAAAAAAAAAVATAKGICVHATEHGISHRNSRSKSMAHLQDRRRQSEACNELGSEVSQVDEAAHVSLLHQLELVPEAVLQGHPVGFAGSQQALQQVGVVGVPAALLQTALHCHSHHLPLGLTLHFAFACSLYP